MLLFECSTINPSLKIIFVNPVSGQVWILEPYGDGDSICLRSHLYKYLAVDQFGNVTCENDEKDDSAKFEISVCDDFSGRWAFR